VHGEAHEEAAPRGGRVPAFRDRADAWGGVVVERLRSHRRLARLLLAMREVAWGMRARAMRGTAVRCPCCEGSFRRMVRSRWPGEARCPRCGSFGRHRLLALLLGDPARGWLAPGARVLHFAPERALEPALRRIGHVAYLTADLYAPADLQLDITTMQLPDASFDILVCSHILEHVPDDRTAMREMLRVLRPGGLAIVLVPLDGHGTTREDAAVRSPLARHLAFGKHDHVRRYGRDVVQRLEDAGFDVETRRCDDLLGEDSIRRHVLCAHETVFLCRRPR
jgi:hypothetical protein